MYQAHSLWVQRWSGIVSCPPGTEVAVGETEGSQDYNTTWDKASGYPDDVMTQGKKPNKT